MLLYQLVDIEDPMEEKNDVPELTNEDDEYGLYDIVY